MRHRPRDRPERQHRVVCGFACSRGSAVQVFGRQHQGFLGLHAWLYLEQIKIAQVDVAVTAVGMLGSGGGGADLIMDGLLTFWRPPKLATKRVGGSRARVSRPESQAPGAPEGAPCTAAMNGAAAGRSWRAGR